MIETKTVLAVPVADPMGSALISCIFVENMKNLYVGAPSYRVDALSCENPGSAPEYRLKVQLCCMILILFKLYVVQWHI